MSITATELKANLGKYLHNLDTCRSIKRTGRLIGKQYIGIVNKRSRHCNRKQ